MLKVKYLDYIDKLVINKIEGWRDCKIFRSGLRVAPSGEMKNTQDKDQAGNDQVP